jgi:hypothetical protein
MNRNTQSNAALNPELDQQDYIAAAHALRSATFALYFRRLISSVNAAANRIASRLTSRTALS